MVAGAGDRDGSLPPGMGSGHRGAGGSGRADRARAGPCAGAPARSHAVLARRPARGAARRRGSGGATGAIWTWGAMTRLVRVLGMVALVATQEPAAPAAAQRNEIDIGHPPANSHTLGGPLFRPPSFKE